MTHPPVALAHLLDLPEGDAWGGLVILHGAGSRALAGRVPASGLATAGDARGRPSLGAARPAAQAAALEWLSEVIG